MASNTIKPRRRATRSQRLYVKLMFKSMAWQGRITRWAAKIR